MKSKYTNKRKFKFLIIAIILAIIICYRFSIAETIKQYGRYEEYRKNIGLSNATINSNYGDVNDSLNHILGRYLLDTLHPDKNLIYHIGSYCLDSNLLITEYKPIDKSGSKISILTRQVVVQGSFNHCLDLVYYLEHNDQVGRVEAVTFWSFTDAKDKMIRLNCRIYIQNLTSLPNETP